MKLGFLLFDYFPYGGLQRDCLGIVSICARRGHDVSLFTRTWSGERPANLRVELAGRRGWTNIARNRAWIRELTSGLPQREFDGVIGFNKLPGLDVYYGSDPCYVARIKRLRPAWYRWLGRYRHYSELERQVFAAGKRTQILLLTQHEIARYTEIYGTEPGRFHLLPPGIPRRTFVEQDRRDVRDRLRAAYGWPADETLLLLVGSGFRVKGVDRAIRALASLPLKQRESTRLIIIGQGHGRPFVRQAQRLGVASRVHFLGGRSDVPDWTLAADLCFQPSYSDAAGMILLEAMTAALPVLTTDTCGYAFHVAKAGAGVVLASPFTQEACNEALTRLLTSLPTATWGQLGLAYAAREDLYSCHERAADIIEETIHRKQDDDRFSLSMR